jgi:ribonuclease BN (tRNA processing enzyme)
VPLTLTVLGTSGSYPGPGRACSGYLVQGGGTTVWLDAGSGSMANLQEHIALTDIDAVVLSHEHPDHWADLNGLEVACTYGPGPDSVPVYAPATVQKLAYGFRQSSFEWHTVADGSVEQIGGQRWSFVKTDHPPETLGARIEVDGVALGYTADTGTEWDAGALGRLDALLAEATFLDDDAAEAAAEGHHVGHLSARQAGQMAKEAAVPRLVITHIWPTHDREVSKAQAEEGFGGPVEVASEHAEFVFEARK